MTPRKRAGFEEVETLLTEPSLPRPSAQTTGFVVECVGSSEGSGSRGQRLRLDGSEPGRSLVGQSPACDLRLADRAVSRRHLSLQVRGSQLVVIDLDSTNGTTVNGLPIGEAYLSGGEEIRLGASSLLVRRAALPKPKALPTRSAFGGLRGESEAMRRLYPLCERLAAANVPVVIEGETGTGKEVLAEALHEQGPRAAGPFAVFDCTAVPPNLVESALFGHEKGAFTGASHSQVGVFEEAHGGTLLIDEIGDLELELQAKLLRALERQQVRRLGGKRWIRVDCRVIAATRRNLDELVQQGRFRDDLFYRLAVARIELPPLRERPGDIRLLAAHFWRKFAGDDAELDEAYLGRLSSYGWPGNVRELHNAVARRVALGDLADMNSPIGIRRPPPTAALTSQADAIERVLERDWALPRARQAVVAEFETRYVERVLRQHQGNVAKAAAASGIARRYFQLIRARTRQRADPPDP